MKLKRASINVFAVVAALVVFGAADNAEAGLFCGRNCQARKAARAAQSQAGQSGAPVYVNGRQFVRDANGNYVAVDTLPQAQPQYQQPQYQQPQYQQPQYQQQGVQVIGQQPGYQTYPQQVTYGGYNPQPQQQTYGSYSNYDYRSKYVALTNQDWSQFAQPYNYIPTPVVGAAFDKTPYPVTVNEPQIQTIIKSAIGINNDADVGSAVVNGALVNKFYSLRGYQPAFITSQGPTQQARIARDLFMNKVVMKGLDPRDYWSNEMESRFNDPQASPYKKTGLDLLMVQSYIQLASDLSNGRSDTKNIDSYFMIKKRVFNDFQALNNTLRDGVNQVSAVESFEPQHPEYQGLLLVLPGLYDLKSRGGYPRLSGASLLKPGITSPDVPILRQRMIDLNLLGASNVSSSQVYDAALAQAVKQFQIDNKLKADGLLGKQGIAVLNVPVEYRIMEVRATLEKWRFLPRSLGDRYIFVNIARQEMQVIENGHVVMAMKSVNGKVLRPTNIIIDKVVSVDLNPYWNPPTSLIIADIQKGQREDHYHMQKEHVKIFSHGQEVDPSTVPWKNYISKAAPYQFREEPGIKNSLGVVKFQTTNNSMIYMHDTNHREFFDDFDERFLSSGCIRLQKPLDLLQYLLRNNPQYGYQQLDYVLNHPEAYPHRVVELKSDEIPFYVFYGTASFDESGKARYARDAYRLDERIVRAMTPIADEN